MLLRCVFTIFFVLFPLCGKSATWIDWSRRLTLGSEKTPRALVIRKLQQIQGLEKTLKKALENPDQRSYALDVIAALGETEFTDLLKSQVREDPDGYSILTLNTLLDDKTYKPVAEMYKIELASHLKTLSPAATVAMIDSLSRWGTELSIDTVEDLLDHDFPEVKLATVSYLGAMVLKFKKTIYLNPIGKLMSQKPYQVRLRALYLFDELPGKKARLSLVKNCDRDGNPIVKNKCKHFRKKWGDEQ